MAIYLDNKKLHAALEEYLISREDAIAAGEEIPRITNFIGENIYLLSVNLARRPNFSGYTYRDDMISNAIELCIRYIHNYNFRLYKNPHAFFTQYAWRAFVDVINLEEKQSYLRAKMAVSPHEIHSALQEVDKDMRPDAEDLTVPFFDIESYEKKNFIKVVPDKDVIIGLEEFIETIDEVEGVQEFKGEIV